MLRSLLLLCAFIITGLVAKAQQPLVSGEFRNLTAEQFFKQVEGQTPYFFYYDARQLDSLSITAAGIQKYGCAFFS